METKLTKEELIQKANEEFEQLTPAQQRVQIAKDVLAQLSLNAKMRKLNIQPGVYFNTDIDTDQFEQEDEVELQAVAQKDEFQCTVCAKGALFVTKALNYNNCLINNELAIDNDDILEALDGIFDEDALDLIENAFECDTVCTNDYYYDPVVASIMFSHIDDAETRLKLIMENIIANQGDFTVPSIDQLTEVQLQNALEFGDDHGFEFLEDAADEDLVTVVKKNINKVDELDNGQLITTLKTLFGYED